MDKKCLFTKATENVNTSVILKSDLGPITVHIHDDELGKTLAEISEQVTTMVGQARELADTFGFDLEEAISKGGMMTIGDPSAAPAPAAQKLPYPTAVVPSPGGLRMQEIPPRPEPEGIHQENSDGSPDSEVLPEASPVPQEAVVAESAPAAPALPPVAPGEKREVKKKVVSPTGRQFEIPESLVDETGETTVMIDTEAEKAFNDSWERQKHDKVSDNSYKDSYGVRFINCKLCVDNKTRAPTGRVNGQPCPKCKGAGEIIVRN